MQGGEGREAVTKSLGKDDISADLCSAHDTCVRLLEPGVVDCQGLGQQGKSLPVAAEGTADQCGRCIAGDDYRRLFMACPGERGKPSDRLGEVAASPRATRSLAWRVSRNAR